MVSQLLTDLKRAKADCASLQEQLTVVSLERKGVLDERDTLVSQLYKEREENRRLEREVWVGVVMVRYGGCGYGEVWWVWL